MAERTGVAERRTRQLQALALQLTEAEERERRRIADLLHDDLQQLLSASRFQLSVLQPAVEGHSTAAFLLQQVDQLLVQSDRKARSLSHELSPAILHHSGLPAAVEWLARRMQKKHGLAVEVQTQEWPVFQNENLRVFLYRAIQEILLNVVKHADTRDARVLLNGRKDSVEAVCLR